MQRNFPQRPTPEEQPVTKQVVDKPAPPPRRVYGGRLNTFALMMATAAIMGGIDHSTITHRKREP